MIRRLYSFLVGGFLFASSAFAQIHPGFTGDALITLLQTDYTPTTVLSLANAKDSLYAALHKKDGGVYCVYTGFFVALDGNPTADPSQDVYNLGAGLNNEHTWPQSLGAGSGNPRADLHHLFPTKVTVNSARSNLPFLEISDPSTDAWYYLDMVETNPSGGDLSLYSERDSNIGWEPRHDHKGNVARAMFYFYTIYESVADSAFFELQKTTLRQWHVDDPVDAEETARSNKIATYQDGKINPFIDDETLVDRAYFEQLLPVELVAFDGKIDNGYVVLEWTTASEINTSSFVVESQNTEGDYRVIANEPATAPAGQGQSYRIFLSPRPGVHRYRLNEVTSSGTKVALSSVEVIDRRTELVLTSPYPNPARGNSSIDVFAPQNEQIQIDMFNLLGQNISTLFVGYADGGVTVEIPSYQLTNGVYLIVASSDKESVSQRFVFSQ